MLRRLSKVFSFFVVACLLVVAWSETSLGAGNDPLGLYKRYSASTVYIGGWPLSGVQFGVLFDAKELSLGPARIDFLQERLGAVKPGDEFSSGFDSGIGESIVQLNGDTLFSHTWADNQLREGGVAELVGALNLRVKELPDAGTILLISLLIIGGAAFLQIRGFKWWITLSAILVIRYLMDYRLRVNLAPLVRFTGELWEFMLSFGIIAIGVVLVDRSFNRWLQEKTLTASHTSRVCFGVGEVLTDFIAYGIAGGVIIVGFAEVWGPQWGVPIISLIGGNILSGAILLTLAFVEVGGRRLVVPRSIIRIGEAFFFVKSVNLFWATLVNIKTRETVKPFWAQLVTQEVKSCYQEEVQSSVIGVPLTRGYCFPQDRFQDLRNEFQRVFRKKQEEGKVSNHPVVDLAWLSTSGDSSVNMMGWLSFSDDRPIAGGVEVFNAMKATDESWREALENLGFSVPFPTQTIEGVSETFVSLNHFFGGLKALLSNVKIR